MELSRIVKDIPIPIGVILPVHISRIHVMIDKKLLSILVCPVSKAPLQYDSENNELLCKASGLAYPVRDGIPVMLESEARQLKLEEKEALE